MFARTQRIFRTEVHVVVIPPADDACMFTLKVDGRFTTFTTFPLLVVSVVGDKFAIFGDWNTKLRWRDSCMCSSIQQSISSPPTTVTVTWLYLLEVTEGPFSTCCSGVCLSLQSTSPPPCARASQFNSVSPHLLFDRIPQLSVLWSPVHHQSIVHGNIWDLLWQPQVTWDELVVAASAVSWLLSA